MTLREVSPHPLVGGDRALEVDAVAGGDLRQRGLVEGLLHDVRGPGRAVGGHDGEAAAVDRDRVTQVDVVEHGVRLDGQPDRVTQVVDVGDGAELLDDAGEHQLVLSCSGAGRGVRVRRTLSAAPSRPGSTVTSVMSRWRASVMVPTPRSPTADRPDPSSIGA